MTAADRLILVLATPALAAFALAAYRFAADVLRGGTKWEDRRDTE